MENPEKTWIRWYERYPNLRELMKLTEELPVTIQESVGEYLIQTVTQYQVVLDNTAEELKSIGPEIVLSLHKSQRKQRWYDLVPQLYKALNMMIVLPEPLLQHMDGRCSGLVAYLRSQKAITMLNPGYSSINVHKFLHNAKPPEPKYSNYRMK